MVPGVEDGAAEGIFRGGLGRRRARERLPLRGGLELLCALPRLTLRGGLGRLCALPRLLHQPVFSALFQISGQ